MTKPFQRALITGGSGFIGRHALMMASGYSDEVYNLSRTSPGEIPGVHHHSMDLADTASVSRFIRETQPQAILHLAATGVSYDSNDLARLLTINVLGLQAMLEAAAALPQEPHCVLAGSWFEYAPQSRPLHEDDELSHRLPYSVSKIAAASIAHHYARRLPVTIMRIFSVYGPGEQLPRLLPYIIDRAQTGESIDVTPGEQQRDYVYVRDVAEGFWRAALHKPEPNDTARILNLGSGRGISLRDFMETAAAVLETFQIRARFAFGARPYRQDEVMLALADTTRLRQILGWVPKTTIQDGLRQTIREMLEKG